MSANLVAVFGQSFSHNSDHNMASGHAQYVWSERQPYPACTKVASYVRSGGKVLPGIRESCIARAVVWNLSCGRGGDQGGMGGGRDGLGGGQVSLGGAQKPVWKAPKTAWEEVRAA